MTRSSDELCADILTAIDNAETYVVQLDGAHHKMAVQAIRDCFMIIGDAAKNLPRELRDSHPEIEWVKIIGMRNIATHEYFKFSIEIAKRTVSEKFPPMRTAIEAIVRGG